MKFCLSGIVHNVYMLPVQVGIDPMRLPIGLDEELELLDELEEERSAAARLPAEFDPESMSLYRWVT